MYQCPLCQTEYTEGKIDHCSVCGWDLTPYPLTFAGQIPEAFLEKERAKLAWARKIWAKSQSQREQLNQQKAQFQQQLTQVVAQLNKLSQAPSPDLTNALSQMGAQLSGITAQLQPYRQEAPQEIQQLQSQIELAYQQRTQEEATHGQLQTQLEKAHAEISRLQTELDKLRPPKLKSCEFSFEVVSVDARGRETQRRRSGAQCLVEDLGDGVILEMVLIAGGTFWMGSSDTETERNDHESPLHQVTIAPFLLGKFTVTQAQWRSVAALPQVNCQLDPDPSRFKGALLPVERVSWYDAVEFCSRLKQRTGRSYRLPSEAEWEYACRAGTTTPFHFGETITPNLANYDGRYTYKAGLKGQYWEQTTQVGSFHVANAFGLCDMHGNVWEWCGDSWHANYQNAPLDGSVWVGENNNDHRLLRGGSWSNLPTHCRSAYRNDIDPEGRYGLIGFRVACSVARTI